MFWAFPPYISFQSEKEDKAKIPQHLPKTLEQATAVMFKVWVEGLNILLVKIIY